MYGLGNWRICIYGLGAKLYDNYNYHLPVNEIYISMLKFPCVNVKPIKHNFIKPNQKLI